MAETDQAIARSAQGAPAGEAEILTDEEMALRRAQIEKFVQSDEDGNHPMDGLWHIGAPSVQSNAQKKEVTYGRS